MNEIALRKRKYLERVVDEQDSSRLGPYDQKLWDINHARLVLGRDVDQANRYFEGVGLDPRPVTWGDGKVDTADWDFLGTALLKTILDLGNSPILSDSAKAHLRSIFVQWSQPRPSVNLDNLRVARWPAIHTENHDLMCLTIGLFSAHFAGQDTTEHLHQLSRSLAWRFERGWVEWHSPCYQVHYLNSLLILARHAPSQSVRKGANDLINLQMAERALLSVKGYLGGPFFRGYDKHIADDRHDSYLPVMWMAFGLAGPNPGLDDGVPFASDAFEPDPVVMALANSARTRPVLDYRGARAAGQDGCQPIRYYNTPHISMGSMSICGYSYQSRYFNVMFGDAPSKSLRTHLREAEFHSVWDKRNERGEAAQHGNWLIACGALVQEGGLKPEKAGAWDLYCAGKGLCAHVELSAGLHLFQVADRDMYPDERVFLSALVMPVQAGHCVRGRTTDGQELSVDLADMSLSVENGSPLTRSGMLHDCPAMRSEYGSGLIEIRAGGTTLVLDGRDLCASKNGLGAGGSVRQDSP
ncbi:MAG: hypothetical protein HY360_18885 [Verrucomicrobia bacterium]|nr:hypothetical protein [Verrucomicrobiota bacterium]